MRYRRVDGDTPKASAAPLLPAINPLVISTTSEMCSLSASANAPSPRESAAWSFLNLHPREIHFSGESEKLVF
jgi:hypothetical protein